MIAWAFHAAFCVVLCAPPSSAPSTPLGRDEVKCLLERGKLLDNCIDPTKGAAAQDACIDQITLDCHGQRDAGSRD